MGGPFAGVELPENFDTQQVSESPGKPEGDVVDKPEASADESPVTNEASAKPDLLDLDKHERFLFNKKEMTRQELADSVLRHGDYTKKVQEVSEARKYADNFETDLARVIEKPELLEKMKSIYPPGYVAIAEKVLQRMTPAEKAELAEAESEPEGDAAAKLPPELLKRIEKVEGFVSSYEERQALQKVEAIKTDINKWFDEFGKKYDLADPDAILNQAFALNEQGKPINREVMEGLFKRAHERMDGTFAKRYSQRVEEQKKASRAAKDVGSGGGTPGSAPKKYKNLRDVRADMESNLGS